MRESSHLHLEYIMDTDALLHLMWVIIWTKGFPIMPMEERVTEALIFKV